MPHRFSFFKTRLAPTPSGYLHAGNALNFLLTAALAKQSGAGLLLRIDDLDRERYRTIYTEDVFTTLRFLNIQWNEGPQSLDDFEREWSQQKRTHLYTEALNKLKDREKVFACVCSRTQSGGCDCRRKALPLDTPNTSWRLITSDEKIFIKVINGTTEQAALPAAMKNFVVRKKDGFPSYQLSSLVDDLQFGIDLIVRGADLWASTLAQQFLAKQLGEDHFAAVVFYHHPLLTNNGEKLSKSAGASSIKHWREKGATLAGFFAYLGALLHKPSEVKSAGDLLKIIMP